MICSTYLDHNATTPVRPEAAGAMASALSACGNPSSIHASGRATRMLIEDARASVAALVGASAAEVIFTSGGTEANALAIKGSRRPRILASAVEHVSVLENAAEAELVPVDRDGIIDLEELDRALGIGDQPSLVALMLANNETGVIQPVARAAEIAHRHRALLHCDAVQAAGKIAIDREALAADSIAVSAHKLGGPMGVGALIVAPGFEPSPQLAGGGQERRRRSGAENLPGIAGFGAAAAVAARLNDGERLTALRERLERTIRATAPEAVVVGEGSLRLPNTTCVALPGRSAEMLVIAFDLAGVAVSAGAACSSGKVTRSAVLRAMGFADDLAGSAIRISLGWTSSESDIERFLAVWTSIVGEHAGCRRRTAA